MELSSFEKLESQVEELLTQYKNTRAARESLAQRVSQLERENEELKQTNLQLREDLENSDRSKSDKEERIKAKVEELLTKIEGI